MFVAWALLITVNSYGKFEDKEMTKQSIHNTYLEIFSVRFKSGFFEPSCINRVITMGAAIFAMPSLLYIRRFHWTLGFYLLNIAQ